MAISSVNAFGAVLLTLYGIETVGGIFPEDEIPNEALVDETPNEALVDETLMAMPSGDLCNRDRNSCIVIATNVTFVSHTVRKGRQPPQRC